MIPGSTVPPAEPHLPALLGGFVVLVAGLALLTRRAPSGEIGSGRRNIRRAVGYCAVYILAWACFGQVLAPALSGSGRSPWLLALGDVLFVTTGLFVWLIKLAERRKWSEYGFRGAPAGRLLAALLFGAGAAGLYAAKSYIQVASGRVVVTGDSFVYALMYATVGVALPEEMLFRGYLQGSLESLNRWTRIVVPALAYTLLCSVRHLPGAELRPDRWLLYVLGVALPLGLWWGLLRDIARGSLWPSLVSSFVIAFGRALAGAPPVFPIGRP
ncbi:MAG: type II CAAX prenyl endopeptidase Rce1 family protein [Candidatus Eisenbacteria bacterium]